MNVNGVYHWEVTTAASFTISSSDASLIGTTVTIPMRMENSFEKGRGVPKEDFDVDFTFVEICVPNLQLTPFAP